MASHLETIQLEHLPQGYDLHIALYRNVTNAGFLHAQLLAGNTDFEYAFVDAGVIISRLHLLASAFRAVNDLLANRLRSRNVHSEIVFCLSPNNNIATSFRTFGLIPTSTSLLAIKLSTPSTPFIASSVAAHLGSSVEGENIPFSDENLAALVDLGRVRKLYKLTGVGVGSGGGKKVVNGVNGDEKGREEKERKELEVFVLGAMALRGNTT